MRNKNIKALWLKGKAIKEEEKILKQIELEEQQQNDKAYLEKYYNYEM